jgi:hypothetical protein
MISFSEQEIEKFSAVPLKMACFSGSHINWKFNISEIVVTIILYTILHSHEAPRDLFEWPRNRNIFHETIKKWHV